MPLSSMHTLASPSHPSIHDANKARLRPDTQPIDKINLFSPKEADITKKPSFRDTLVGASTPIFLEEINEPHDPNWELRP